jgi:hypothetical protein
LATTTVRLPEALWRRVRIKAIEEDLHRQRLRTTGVGGQVSGPSANQGPRVLRNTPQRAYTHRHLAGSFEEGNDEADYSEGRSAP